MSQPANVGRYHVVGHLASGGMADIFLGKLLGPSGFERPVVLKRILPKLVGRQNVLQMFLDEARLAARIQHANVVHVQELVEEDGGFYLVMEFLEGESALGMMKRAARRRERIPPVLAAHVIAEACAGIHAAHELKSDNGEPLGLVHRDISPGNVFVTYSGEVKVLDFGIAKFKAKSTETQVGKVRGKFAYMSPEQCRGKPVDRRSDIFALGTLLFELSTGRRLFARETHRLTMKAVTRAKLPPMKRLDPSYPEELVTILERCLAVDPNDRYPTAARLRRDLIGFVQNHVGDHLPEERISQLMNSWFPNRVTEKRALLREVRQGTNVTYIPEAEPDSGVELPDADTVVTPQMVHQQSTVETPNFSPTAPDTVGLHPRPPHASYVHTTPAEPGRAASEPPPPVATPQAPTRAPWVWALVGGALVAVGIGVGVVVATSDDGTGTVMPTDTGSVSREPEDTPRTVEVPDSPPPAETSTVEFVIGQTPHGSRIYVNGEFMGSTPATIRVPYGEAPVEVRISHDGYETWSSELTPDSTRQISGELTRVRAARRRRAGRRQGSTQPPSDPTPPPNDDPFQRYDR